MRNVKKYTRKLSLPPFGTGNFPFTGFRLESSLIMTDVETGIVKWFDPQKGYGYIERDKGGEVYVHYSAVICEESECHLEEGNRVEFTIHQGPKGPQAQDVIVLN